MRKTLIEIKHITHLSNKFKNFTFMSNWPASDAFLQNKVDLSRCYNYYKHASCTLQAYNLQEKSITSTRKPAGSPARLSQLLQTSCRPHLHNIMHNMYHYAHICIAQYAQYYANEVFCKLAGLQDASCMFIVVIIADLKWNREYG